jgi:diguanylate cyclase (GGDEF)-like protein
VLNRRAFLERAQQAWERLQAEGGAASIALVDADYFKKINDTRGHQVGDRTLQRIAAALQADLAAGTPVGRMGGEEFAVLLAGADTDTALAAAEAARARVGSDHLRPEGVGFPVTVSIGVASLHAGKVASVEDWLLAADKALYAAKAAGRNRVFVAGPEQFLRTATI